MTQARLRGDQGQAFPIYITVVAGLLFLAFAYFAVGQAAATRNGAQTAADASALAAAQEARDQLLDGFLDALGNGDAWEDWLEGDGFTTAGACAEASNFADKNDSDVTRCEPAAGIDDGFTVEIKTRYTVGESIVPGTEEVHGEAEATAVIEPRCRVQAGDETDEEPPGGGEGEDGEDEDKAPIEFTCDDRDWTIDPDLDDLLPEAADLFSVHLSD